jgi:hypothetical protein
LLLRRGLAAALIAGLAAFGLPAHTAPVRASGVPTLDHVFVIVMENSAYSSIIGSSSAPYINSLVKGGGLATNYFAITHPSLPNYLALTGGSTYGITSDCTTCWVSATNIGDRVEAAGKNWKAYEESMPSPCFVGDSYPYVQKHDPFIYFNDIRTNTARCQSHVVPFTQMTSDLASTSTTPNYAFITPNMCNDMHDCSTASGDAWLAQRVPQILTSPAFATQHSVLALVWDEDDSSGSNQVPLILLGNGIGANLRSSTGYNHYSALRTVESGLGLPTLTSNDAAVSPMNDFFGLVGWNDVGGAATTGADASSWGSSRSDVFVRGTDNALWHRSWNGTAWGGWESLDGFITAEPTAVSWGTNRIDIFVRGSDFALWHRTSNGTTWGSWERLGGYLSSGPDAASWGANRLDVFVSGLGNRLWQDTWNGTSWAWTSLGGVGSSDPGVVASAPNHIDIFVRGTDQALWEDSWNGSSWSWTSLGGAATTGPDASSCAAGHIDVFIVGMDGSLWQRGFNGSTWGGWANLHGNWTNTPSAVCPPGTNTIQLFEIAPDLSTVQSTATGS